MKHLLFALTAFCVLMNIVSCDEQKKSEKAEQADLEQVYELNVKDSVLATGWYYIVDYDNGFKRQLDKTDEFYFVDPKPIVVKGHFSQVKVHKPRPESQYDKYPRLTIKISKKYSDLWAEATEKSIGKRLGFVIDDMLIYAPWVNMRIEGGKSSITRDSIDELENFKRLIEE